MNDICNVCKGGSLISIVILKNGLSALDLDLKSRSLKSFFGHITHSVTKIVKHKIKKGNWFNNCVRLKYIVRLFTSYLHKYIPYNVIHSLLASAFDNIMTWWTVRRNFEQFKVKRGHLNGVHHNNFRL